MGDKKSDFGLLGPLFEAALAEEDALNSTKIIDSEPPQPLKADLSLSNSISCSEEEEIEVAPTPQVYSVSELANELRDTLKDSYPRILVRGEIADFKGIHRSGHLYCTLKDESAQIRMVMWKTTLSKIHFQIEGGQEVIATAKVDFYPGGGSLQLSVEHLEPVGIGALQLRFEQLKKKLQAEGLFEDSRKRAIPAVAWKIGLVTGKSTAALQDMLKIFKHRFPLSKIFLFHASVQGEKASQEICKAVNTANRFSKTVEALDCLILARGGGSYEDLFCFNEENVARAIVQSKLPTITGIGHEIDITIADMVADRRAATPTHAAQMVVPEALLWLQRLNDFQNSFERRMREKIEDLRQTFDILLNRLQIASPQKRLVIQTTHLADLQRRLIFAIEGRLRFERQKLAQIGTKLDALSPLKVFDRGFSLVEISEGKFARSVNDLKSDQIVELLFRDGKRQSRVL